MKGLVDTGNDLINEVDKGPVLVVALIGAAQMVDDYGIASCTALVLLATKLGYPKAVPLRQASLADCYTLSSS